MGKLSLTLFSADSKVFKKRKFLVWAMLFCSEGGLLLGETTFPKHELLL